MQAPSWLRGRFLDRALTVLSCGFTVAAWIFPSPLEWLFHGVSDQKVLTALYMVVAVSFLIVVIRLIERKITHLGALTLLLIFGSGSGMAFLVGSYGLGSPAPQGETEWNGQGTELQLDDYCKEARGAGAVAALGKGSSPGFFCESEQGSWPIDLASACLAFFGSTRYALNTSGLSLVCDDTKRTVPPCKEDQEPCLYSTSHCCPASKRRWL